MYIKLILLFAIYHVNVISGQGIGVIFNNTLVLDNSTITWDSSNLFQCGISSIETTIDLDQTLMTTTVVESNYASTYETDIMTTESQMVILISSQSSLVYSCRDGSLGTSCNISSNVCLISNPCLNGATCYSNSSLSLGYSCQCASGFSGDDCQNDNRICTDSTCWNNGTCSEINTTVSGSIITSFTCQCVYGYDGTSCEFAINQCENITCENNGICISSYLEWSCQCLDSSLYSGTYCQDKSSALATKQALSKSFAYIAIVAIGILVAFIILMDILKYVFKIDPLDREQYRLKMQKEKEQQLKFQKKTVKKKNKDVMTRFSLV